MLEPVLVFKDKNETIPYSKIIVPSSMRSPLWKFFGFPANASNEILTRKKIVCGICRAYIAYNKNTTNLSTHLNCKHPEVLAEFQGDGKKSSDSKKIRIESNEGSPTKRIRIESKFDNDIDTDWYIENETTNESTLHPTGISAKEFVQNKNMENVIELYIDNERKSKTKKSIQIDESYALVISPDEPDGENQLIETLSYDHKEFGDSSAEDISHKGDYLAEDDFLTDINEENVQNVYEEPKNSNVMILKNDKSDMKVVEPSKIMDALKSFLVKDLITPDVIGGTGFRALLHSLSSNVEIPKIAQVQESLQNDYDQLHSNALSKLETVLSQQKYSILFNKLGEHSLLEISIGYLSDNDNKSNGLERQLVQICENSERFFNNISNHLNKCCAFLINFEISDCEDPSIERFSKRNGIPIIQTFSSVFEVAISKCIQVAPVAAAVNVIKNSDDLVGRMPNSCLAKLKFLSQLIDENEDITEEIISVIPIIQTFVSCLQPIKNCLDVLAFESTTYASIMKPIAIELLNQHYTEQETAGKTTNEILENDLKRTIAEVLRERIISNDFLTMASFLDPRFQGLTTADDLNCIRNQLEKSIQQTETAHTLKTDPKKPKPDRSSLGLSSLFAKHSSATKSKMPKNRFDIEFRSYTEDVSLDMDQCPLTWWTESEVLYPNIKRQITKYFCVPAFVNDVHRLSVAKQIELFEKYNKMDKNFDQTLLWLHLSDLRQNFNAS